MTIDFEIDFGAELKSYLPISSTYIAELLQWVVSTLRTYHKNMKERKRKKKSSRKKRVKVKSLLLSPRNRTLNLRNAAFQSPIPTARTARHPNLPSWPNPLVLHINRS